MILPPSSCKVYTPPLLADAMVEALRPVPQDLWLDPCVGPGAFIEPLRKRGVPKERIIAVDIEPRINLTGTATVLHGTDFFQWCASTDHRFSKIVANPPYVAISKLHPTLRQPFGDFMQESDRSFALSSNYWCAFLSASLRLLKDHGNLAFVLPAAWEYALYANDVRRSVFERFETVEVHRCLEPLFAEVREGCVVLLAKGYRKPPERLVRLSHPTPQALIAGLTHADHKTATKLKVGTPADASLTPFSDIFKIGIGCVTGDARYFLLTESNRKEHDLPLSALRPVVSKARHLIAGRLSKEEWERLHRDNERVWMFSPGRESLRLKSVQAYLAHGQKVCNLSGYKLSNREPWYTVPDVAPGTGFLSGMTKLGPWIAFRAMRGLVATNTLYVVTEHSRMSVDERCAWGLSLLSTPCRKQFRALARRYPDGLPKLEPHDVSSLRLPLPNRTKDASRIYANAVRLLIADREADATAIADAFLEPNGKRGNNGVGSQQQRHKTASSEDNPGC